MAFLNKLLALVLGLLCFLNNVKHIVAVPCAGCIDLDEINFDKTIKRFPYSLVKYDVAFPFGPKHDAFAEFSKAAHKVTDDLLVACVGIKDYGENENKKLGERFDIVEKNFPQILLFIEGSTENFIRFPSHLDITLDNLKQFVTQNTELYIGRDGCLKQFNTLAKNYANQEDPKQLELILEGEILLSQLTKAEEQKSAQTYLTFMRKINEKGYNFVEEETKRLLRLKAGKVTDAKKLEISYKLNILESFRVTKLTKEDKPIKDDL